jgi:segregation and condensation protein A
MASELMLIKSKMLLPRITPDEKDPRAELADALLRYQQAKQAAAKMAPLYQRFSGRMVKDTDEITVDVTYVADQEVTDLCLAVRRIIAANESRPKAEKQVFAPMIAKPIVPVDVKIVGILHHMSKKPKPSMKELLSDATSLSDLIAIFLGILELIKVRKILIDEDEESYVTVHGSSTRFIVNENPEDPSGEEAAARTVHDDDEPIPLSSKAEMHREQRRIIREQKLAEKKRLREEARAKRAEERRLAKESALAASDITDAEELLPPDDSDLEAEAQMAALIDERLSQEEEDLLDDLGLDMQEIVRTMAKQAKDLPDSSK